MVTQTSLLYSVRRHIHHLQRFINEDIHVRWMIPNNVDFCCCLNYNHCNAYAAHAVFVIDLHVLIKQDTRVKREPSVRLADDVIDVNWTLRLNILTHLTIDFTLSKEGNIQWLNLPLIAIFRDVYHDVTSCF